MKEQRKTAKDGGDSTDPMTEMRRRYERAVEAERDNRDLALDDLRFVTLPGYQWDEQQRKARRNRPCYEFPILRALWRQVVNDQKKARPGIKIRAVEDADAEGAELRQGIIRNIEAVSNAERAYDGAFELMTAGGMGAWRVLTKYSEDDGWEQDIRVEPITDPLSSVWLDPACKDPNGRDAMFAFVEESVTRDEFKRRWPDKDPVDFETAKRVQQHDWFREKDVRICEYWRKEPVTKTLLLLSDGRTLDKSELTPEMEQQLQAEGVEITRERQCKTWKVVSSIVSGAEELEGPFDSVFERIPIVVIYGNRFFIDGRWRWAGMVRAARDAQKLANYNLTTGQEALAKQHKAMPIVTPTMLEGEGVKAMWDKSNTMDLPYLPITPDPLMPGGPRFLEPPPVHAAFVQMGQMSMDLVKTATSIFDASMGARSNETSGKAILARQQEGDTATYDYQDSLGFGIQATGELILSALPKVYDTPRAMRVLGKDGGEDWVKINEQTPDGQTINDLSSGKYDTTVTSGPSYDTQRMEFVDAMVQLSNGNPVIQQGCPDLIIGSMDFPKAEEAAERLKLLLPPQIQASLNKDAKLPPEVMQAQQQVEQQMQQVQEAMVTLHQAHVASEAEQQKLDNAKAMLDAQQKLMEANFAKLNAELAAKIAESNAHVAESGARANEHEVRADHAQDRQMLMDHITQLQAHATDTLSNVHQIVAQALQQQAQPSKPKSFAFERDADGNLTAAHVVEG